MYVPLFEIALEGTQESDSSKGHCGGKLGEVGKKSEILYFILLCSIFIKNNFKILYSFSFYLEMFPYLLVLIQV